ncbi:MAG: glutaminyl-peptide cyclotransferase, partial [Actinomycetota bacterium]
MRPPNPLPVAVTTLVMVIVLGACTGSDADDGSVAAAPTGSAGATTTASTTDAATSTSTSTPASTSASASAGDPGEIVTYVVKVFATYPHDTAAYTQGLEVVDDLLLESTGVRGESSIRLVEPETGEIVESTALDPNLFGEGATIVGDEVWQLTWTSGILLVHGLDDLATRRQLIYAGEGWGLCAMDDRLVMSDGSSLLTSR